MNLKNSVVITTITLLLFFLIGSFSVVDRLELMSYGMLGFIIFVMVIILNPDIVSYLYAVSMFLGISVFVRESVSVDIADVLFPLFLLINIHLINKPLSKRYKSVIISLFIFIITMCISIPINFFKHPMILSIGMPWYVYRAIQVPAVIIILYHFLNEKKERFSILFTLILVAAMVQIPVVFFQKMFNHTGNVIRAGVHGTFLYHHSLIAMVFFALLPLFIAEAVESKKLMKKTVAAVLSLFSFYIIVVSGSRSILLGLLGGGIVCFI